MNMPELNDSQFAEHVNKLNQSYTKSGGETFRVADDESHEGPYCPNCAEDVSDWTESMDYWQNERPKLAPHMRVPCAGCGAV